MIENKYKLEDVDTKWLQENMRCQNTCPVYTDVPGYIKLIAEGRYEEAYSLIRETNPFPSICGRVCHKPCEAQCRRGEIDEPVSIDALKRFVADFVRRSGRETTIAVPKEKRGRVAIIGAGPVGLTAAHTLARLGYGVTVFESSPVVGGMLRLGIPEYRLPRDILDFEIDHIREHDVEIRTNTPIGGEVTFDDLRGAYDAILIAIGAHKSLKLNIPGEDNYEGIVDCLDFLRSANLGDTRKLGDRVVIIGGGNSAVDSARMALRVGAESGYYAVPDAARTARRLGAQRVDIVYRRSGAEMPADPVEVGEAEREGVKIHYLTAPVEIIGRRDGHVVGLVCIRMELGEPDESGRPQPIPIEGSQFLIEADVIISAIGERPDLSFLPEGHRIQVSERGSIVIDEDTMATGEPGVFAAGDVVTGPKTVIEGIAVGHKAAVSIHRYLVGGKKEWELHLEDSVQLTDVRSLEIPPEIEPYYDTIKRQRMPSLPLEEREDGFEVELGFTEEMAVKEAKRCLQCNINILIESKDCIGCGRCSEVCPYGCIQMVTLDGKEDYYFRPWFRGKARLRDETLCIRCGLCKDYCPVDSVTYKRAHWRREYAEGE